MDKYDGIARAEVILSPNDTAAKPRKKRSAHKAGRQGLGFLIRLTVAALMLGALFGLKALGLPVIDKALDFIKSAVTYDLTGDGSGEIRAVELIGGLISGEEEKQD